MRSRTYFLVKLKEYTKPIRMTQSNIKKLMTEKDYICIDSLIYDEKENIVGSLITKPINPNYITKDEFFSLPLVEIMRRLGSLDAAKWIDTRIVTKEDMEWM